MTTTIFVKISAADAVKSACECGQRAINVDLSTWTPDEREWLAGKVKDDQGARLDRSIAPPTPERLHEWVQQQLAAAAAERAATETERVRFAQQSEDDVVAMRTYINTLTTAPLQEKWDTYGVTGNSVRRASAALDALGIQHWNEYVTPYSIGRGDEWDAKLAADKAVREAKEAEDEAERKVKCARAEAEFSARVAAVPAVLREKFEAGFATRDEIDYAYLAIALEELGLQHDDTSKEEKITTLSDEEFAALKEARARFPEFAVEPMLVWSYRKSNDDDDDSVIDRDGDVKVEERIIQVIIERHGLMILGKIPMPTE